ncbi:DegT/DnrJ/EryC1/StrS family aminotransferase [Phenylobacterium sp.]|uniref:DegT/DnrJ/EryC1/StrS family aminotransferase n=1 Tax=Phenylobacterium sp. TaxID=1871053 RepID=UPI002FE175E5
MIPVCEPDISDGEIANVLECVKSGWISSQGPFIGKLEATFASFHGVKHAVALANGTAAVEVALHAAGVGRGDEVILPSFTIISVALAVVRLGAIPRFVDVDAVTWNLDPDQVEAAVTPRTRAVVIVHTYGHPADMDRLMEIARRHGLKVVEDTAEAIASRWKGKLCGTFGDVAAFSLYANKLVTTGEGGIIITDDDEAATRARKYINLYFGQEERFAHTDLGYNFRMTNLQAAVGVAQMERIEEFKQKKAQVGAWYAERLRNSRLVDFQKTVGDVDVVYWMYCVTLKDEVNMTAATVMEKLKEKGVGTRPFFKGLHLQAPLRQYVEADAAYPVTERIYERGFYLPSSVTLSEAEVASVCEALEDLA